MRIAHVNPDPGIAPGRRKGASVHVLALRQAFAALGHEVLAIDQGTEEGVRAALGSALSAGPLDLVYERHALARHAAGEFALARGIPHVLEVNAPLEEEEERFRGAALGSLDRARQQAGFAAAALLSCVSQPVARYVLERGARAGRVLVLPNAVDPGLFRPREPDDALRARLVPAERVAVGFHGRLRPWHRFEALVEALETLLARGLPLHLVLLGEGDFAAGWRGRIPESHVTHIPWLEHGEAARVVASFDLLPLCYAAEPVCYFSPLKLLEGMAVGAVPVVPALGDLEAIVAHERNGLVYAAGDAHGFAAAIERLARQPGLRTRLAAAARERALQHTWQDVARVVLEHAARGERACA